MKQKEMSDHSQNDAKLNVAWRAALRSEDAPKGFAERLEARMAEEERSLRKAQPAESKLLSFRTQMFRKQAWLAIAAALMLAVLLPVGWQLHHHAEVARGEAAKQQVMLALRITGTHLRQIQQHTHTINAGMPEGDPQ